MNLAFVFQIQTRVATVLVIGQELLEDFFQIAVTCTGGGRAADICAASCERKFKTPYIPLSCVSRPCSELFVRVRRYSC